MRWILLSANGNYNDVYRNEESTLVLKIPKEEFDGTIPATDIPERAVRLWNELNSHIYPDAKIVETTYGKGWLCPFVEGEQASDKEIGAALVDIYNRSGRIVMDALAPKNFIKRQSDGLVVCVDVGLALQLEQKQNSANTHRLTRQKSETSLLEWEKRSWFFESKNREIEEKLPGKYPHTLSTCRALIFLKTHRPDVVDVIFLKHDLELRDKLAQAHAGSQLYSLSRSEKVRLHEDALAHLDSVLIKSIQYNPNSPGSDYPQSQSSSSSSEPSNSIDRRGQHDDDDEDDEDDEKDSILEDLKIIRIVEENPHVQQHHEEPIEMAQRFCISELKKFKEEVQLKQHIDPNTQKSQLFKVRLRTERELNYADTLISCITQMNTLDDVKEKISTLKEAIPDLSQELGSTLDQCLQVTNSFGTEEYSTSYPSLQ